MRDATGAEIHEEPDAILEAMVAGDLDATWTTRELAKNELERRGILSSPLEKTAAV